MTPRTRAGVVLGASLVVSLAANIAAGQWTVGGVAASAVAPAALYGSLELARGARPRERRDWLGWLTWLAAFTVAGLAFVVSYRHQQAVAIRFGQDDLAASLLPVMVDIPIAVATLRLAVLARAPRRMTETISHGDGLDSLRVEQITEQQTEIESAKPGSPTSGWLPGSLSSGAMPATGTAYRARPLAMPLDQARALLADVPRKADGTVSVRAAATAWGVHHTRAKPILDNLGLLTAQPTE